MTNKGVILDPVLTMIVPTYVMRGSGERPKGYKSNSNIVVWTWESYQECVISTEDRVLVGKNKNLAHLPMMTDPELTIREIIGHWGPRAAIFFDLNKFIYSPSCNKEQMKRLFPYLNLDEPYFFRNFSTPVHGYFEHPVFRLQWDPWRRR